jgi:hypothetical protein
MPLQSTGMIYPGRLQQFADTNESFQSDKVVHSFVSQIYLQAKKNRTSPSPSATNEYAEILEYGNRTMVRAFEGADEVYLLYMAVALNQSTLWIRNSEFHAFDTSPIMTQAQESG